MTTSIDAQLIIGFKDGDVQCFNRLVRRWQNRLYRFAFRYVLDEEDAKDVVQAAFIKAYKNLEKLKDPEKFHSWIFQITVNLCKDMLKSSHRTRLTYENRGSSEENSMKLDEMPGDRDTGTVASRSELSDIVRDTLSKIPDEQRIVIIMKEYDGFKFAEIAEILNCPLNTVKARMYYGMRHMAKILTKLNIDQEVVFNEM